MKTAVVTSELGDAVFPVALAGLLAAAGSDVTLIYAGDVLDDTRFHHWRGHCAARGVRLLCPPDLSRSFPLLPDAPFVRRAEAVAAALDDGYRVVYLADWSAAGFLAARQCRFRSHARPLLVALLHSPSEWRREQAESWGTGEYAELALDYAESYIARFSDLLIAHDPALLNWASEHGWTLPPQTRLLPFQPGDDWLSLHSELCRQAEEAATSPAQLLPSVDVCIAYYNHGAYLPQCLDSLVRQTAQNFTVTVVNDGSTDPESQVVFAAMAEQYRPRGWRFLSRPNGGASAARNTAAAQGKSDFLCFVDADNIAAPHMIERFSAAITASGDDCLTCHFYVLYGEDMHYNPASGTVDGAISYEHAPLGPALALGCLVNVFGDTNCILRRSAFEAVGGFTAIPGIGHDDWHLFARLSLAGFRLDVIPQPLFYYRLLPHSYLRTTSPYHNLRRIHQLYHEALQSPAAPLLSAALRRMWASQRALFDHLPVLRHERDVLAAAFDAERAHRAAVESTLGFRLLSAFGRLKNRLLPEGTRRHRLYQTLRQRVRG